MKNYLVLSRSDRSSPRLVKRAITNRALDEPSDFSLNASSEDLSDREAADRLRDPDVEDVVTSMPFTLIEPVTAPDNAKPAGTTWGLDAVGATQCPQNGAGVTVAILDTGIDRQHEAFAGIGFGPENLMDFTVQEQGVAGSAEDVHGHGTHVAGTIFGRTVAGQRIGVAPGITRILIGKVLGKGGGPTGAVFNALQWALIQGADVISLSLGVDFPKMVTHLMQQKGLPADIATSRALEAYRENVRLFDRLASLFGAHSRSALLIAAAGNASRREQDPRFTVAASPPAAADGFISVGAVAQGAAGLPMTVAPFSNTGCWLAGPGVSILSAQRGGGLVGMSGTSMATPHVAGVAALWIQRKLPPGRRPKDWTTDIRRHLESTAVPVPGQARSDVGLGLVRAPQ